MNKCLHLFHIPIHCLVDPVIPYQHRMCAKHCQLHVVSMTSDRDGHRMRVSCSDLISGISFTAFIISSNYIGTTGHTGTNVKQFFKLHHFINQ